MERMSASEARQQFAELVNRVKYGKTRVLIGRRGKEVAAVVSVEDLRLLERLAEDLEDRLDAEEAARVLADESDERVPWEQARKGLTRGVPRKRHVQRPADDRKAARPRAGGDRPRHRRAR